MTSSVSPPPPSPRTSSDVTALVAELGRVIKGRRFYGPGNPQLPRLFERALRAWQAELARHGEIEFRLTGTGLHVVGLPAGAVGEFPTLVAMLRQRGFHSLRVEPPLDAEGFAALLEVLVSDPVRLAREGGVERALYARAPMGFVVNGSAPSAAAPAPGPAAPEETTQPEPAENEAAAPTAASVPSDGTTVEATTAPPSPRTAVTAADFDTEAEPPEPEPGFEESAPPPAAESHPAAEPEVLPTAVAHDAMPPIPDSLLDPEPGFASDGPATAGHVAGLVEEPCESLAGVPRAPAPPEPPDEETTSPDLGDFEEAPPAPAAPEADEPSFEFVDPPPLVAEASGDAPEGPAPAFADEPAVEETPTLGMLPAPAAPAPESALDFGAEPLELDDEGDPASSPGDSVGDFTFESDDPPPARPEPDHAEPAPPPAPAPIHDGSGGHVAELLRELDDCSEDLIYSEIADRVADVAEKLAEQGLENDAYVVVRALAAHAGGESKRSPEQRELALGQLRRLAGGSLFDTVLGCACDETDGNLEASQILVQLGSNVVVPVFRAAARERNAERRERIHGILVAMGDEALPDLLRLMRDEDPAQARAAVRLAGEVQSPGAVGRLAELLESPSAALSQEVSKALARIGDATALHSLAEGLESPVGHVPGHAAYALGASGSEIAVAPLLRALHRAIDDGDSEFARDVIRSLGRLGRPEATPDLAGILLRRGLVQRRRHRELKLAAAAALGRLPGDEAVGALAQAAQSRDAHIRRAAQIALDRRAQAIADS